MIINDELAQSTHNISDNPTRLDLFSSKTPAELWGSGFKNWFHGLREYKQRFCIGKSRD